MSKSANRKSRSNEGIILYQNNVGKTVQTSWRPQLPLPKEVVPPTTSAEPSMRSSETNRRSSAANTSNKKDSHQSAPQVSAGGNKKWSFGRLFRKKKEAETESSSDEDRKAGFVGSPKYRKKDKKKRGSKHISGAFDHIVVSPTTRDNEFFLPFEPIPAGETTHLAPPVEYDQNNRSTNSLDRRGKRDRKQPISNDPQRHASSEEEMISLNSSTTFAKYRSDESLGSGGNANGGQSRRSRAARNERYYKRLSRDGEVSHGQVPVMYAAQPAQRWKTQPVPLSVYNGQPNQIPVDVARPQYPPPVMHKSAMRNSTSLSHMAPHLPINYGMPRPTQNLQNTVNDNKRSISFDSQIHLQNAKKPLPPPPPPRDPMRRVNVAGHTDHRPISYAFDQSSSHVPPNTGMRGRCVSDDRIWSGIAPMYQSASSINQHPPSVASSHQSRRFITRAERDAHPTKKSLPAGLDFRYVAEGVPRSRKPIHLFNENENKSAVAKPPSPVIIRTTKSGLPDSVPPNPQLSSEYWRRGREQHQQRPESMFNKPRSLSSSRAGELRSCNTPMYSEVVKPKPKPDDVDSSVVSGKLLIKPSKDSRNNYVEIRNNANKSNSMPNHYQRRDLGMPRGPKADSPTPNKYDEYVAEKKVRNILDRNISDQPLKLAPDPPQRKVITKPLALPPEPDVVRRKKHTNLEDAINELEAIYKSLKLGDESLLDRADRRDIPTPTNFEKYAETHSEEFLEDDDDDEPAAEPDLVKDDFAYRNIKHSNLALKAVSDEKQPPFGIPVGPIAISPRSDYLHVTPDKDCQKVRTGPFKYPDIVCDDLAVRTLRKDPPGQVKPHVSYPVGSKKRATRTQSANIYTLIQRNATKPSGGDIDDFLELAKSLERAGSMSDIHKDDDDRPSTLHLLRNLREQEHGSPKVIPFRHPSQGGAICSLPAILSRDTKPPVPLPRKSLTPDPEKSKMEDALNKIAKEARESSEKLTRDLMELRKEALITTSRSKLNKPNIERDLEQIEAVSEAAKRCRHLLLDTIPPKDADEIHQKQSPPRRLITEDKLIKAIDQVSNAANMVCEKILSEIVTVEPPVIVQNPVEVKNRPEQKLVMPSLIQKLDPSSARIGEIAERCMRQISQLNDTPDYDNLQQIPATACNDIKNENDRDKRSDADLLIVPGSGYVTAAENEEEIDMIMKECEKQARVNVSKSSVRVKDPVANSDGDKTTTAAAPTTSASSSSSDCLKSSSSSVGPHLSSSITSFNPYSSSDYIKSPSSEFHAPSTDPIKTFSTTSYDVQSSSVTPNITNSPFSYSTPSPPLNLTVCSSGGEKGERSGSASQYNSSEELAMIFGMEKSSPATTTTESIASKPLSIDFENNLSSSSTTANLSCQQQLSQQNQRLYSGLKSQYPSSTASSSQKSNLSRITTEPAYYTDEYLQIQTSPPLTIPQDYSESPSINENYRSVYATPSKLLIGDNRQNFFPKSPTAIVAPPPIAAKRTIFQNSPPLKQQQQQQKPKGDLPLPRSSSSSAIFFAQTDEQSSRSNPSNPAEVGPTPNPVVTEGASASTNTSSRSSNAGRFSNKRRVVRVRSDSRPISALYDIICKEKGIELDQEPTMSSNGGGVVGIDSASSSVDSNPTDRLHYKDKHLDGRESSPTSSQLNSAENLNINRYRSRPLSYQDDNRYCGDDNEYDNDNGEQARTTYNRLQMKPDILTTSSSSPSSYLASELNHYQQFDHNHPDHHHHHHDLHQHPHAHHCNEPNLPSSCVDSSLNNYRDSSSYINRNNELSDVHAAEAAAAAAAVAVAGATSGNHRPPTANGHFQQMHHQVAAPRPTPRLFRDEKRRFTDGIVMDAKANAIESGIATGNGAGSDGDNGRMGSQQGRRYITRSNRTTAGGGAGSNNSDSSPSPIQSATSASAPASQNRLTPSSPSSISSSNRLRSPLKSPLINRPYHHHYSAPSSAFVAPLPGSGTINGNGNNHHHQLQYQQQQQQHQQVDPYRSVMTNSVGAVATAAAAPIQGAAASSLPLNDICGKSVSPTNKHNELYTNGRVVKKSSSSSSIIQPNNNQHRGPAGLNQSPNPQQPTTPTKTVRTTKTSRLRAAALDRKKDSDDQHPSGIPTMIGTRQTSPRHSSRKPGNNNSPDVTRSAAAGTRSGLSASPPGSKKLVPSVSVTMRQNLNELRYNGNSGIARREQRPHTTECTVKIASGASGFSQNDEQFLNGNEGGGEFSSRPRCSTMNSEINRMVNPARSDGDIELSPVRNSQTPEAQRIEDRDKSSKRKSNLNRSLNEEATGDDEAALRRRRRRELGMARQLIPSDETSTALRDLLLSPKKSSVSPTSPRNNLAFHMENARRGIGLISPSASERRRASTASPKISGASPTSPAKQTETKIPRRPVEREAFSLSLGGRSPSSEYVRRNRFRFSDVGSKVDAMRERTKSELADIIKITEMCDDNIASGSQKVESGIKPPLKKVPNAIDDFANSLDRIAARDELPVPASTMEPKELNSSSSSASPRSFVKKDRISFDDGEDFHSDGASSLGFLRRRMLKARSVEREISLDQPKLSPILRRKSSDEPTNHIVSILKKKDQAESSSTSSNASPVTFASTTMDTPTRSKRQGILKKRSSLDESRYYSRSHSPDERSILVKSARRNSLEEIQHGILKQSSYESKSDGCPSAEPHHGILKKKDSISTPSESSHPSKHVSISQAVILAAAELCKDIVTSSSSPPNSNDSEYDNIRPILKVDSQEIRAPKPILKKKSSSETEEIRPILKTSRKSSREESSDQSDDQGKRSIRKTDSPAKRRSFAESPSDMAMTSNAVIQRSKSLEPPSDEGAVGGGAVAQPSLVMVEEKPVLSVAERVRNMERFLSSSAGRSSDENSPGNCSAGAIPKILRPSAIKREMYKDRFRTQPVTNDEIQCLQAATTGSLDTFKSSFSLDSLNYKDAGEASAVVTSVIDESAIASTSSAAKISPRSLSSISPSPRGENSDIFSPRSVTDLNCVSISSDSGLQTGRHFEMSSSGMDDSSPKADNSLSMMSDSANNSNQRLPRDDSLTLCEDESGMETTTGHRTGLGRSGSVKARASMFQQLEEKTKAVRMMDEKVPASPITRRVPRCLSSSPPTPADEPKTPNNPPMNTDEEFEPSSLPLAERLRFFSSLSEVSRNSRCKSMPATRNHQSNTDRRGSSSSVNINQLSPSSSSPTTPRSSIVPMDFEETPTTTPIAKESLSIPEENPIITTPTTTVSPTKRIKLKTIGKLIMPSFFNDRNNNNANSVDNNAPSEPVKKIGKIKSPFIENSQKSSFGVLNGKNSNKCMKYDLKSMPTSNTGKDDENCDVNDSGKENYDNTLQGVVEMRKKKVSTSSSSSGFSSAPASQRNSYQHSIRSPPVDKKYLIYFGPPPNTNTNNFGSRNTTPTTPHKSFDYSNMPDVCRVTPKPHLRQQNFTYSIDEIGFGQKSCSPKEVRVIPPSPATPSQLSLSPVHASDDSEVFDDSDFGISSNSSLAPQLMVKRRDPLKGARAMTVFVNTPQSTPERKVPTLRDLRTRSMTITHTRYLPREPQNPISKFEDLKLTKEDLLTAHKEFERIFLGVV